MSCDLHNVQVAELRQRVAGLGLETKGTKAELIARVEKYLSEQGMSYDNHVMWLKGRVFTDDVMQKLIYWKRKKTLRKKAESHLRYCQKITHCFEHVRRQETNYKKPRRKRRH